MSDTSVGETTTTYETVSKELSANFAAIKSDVAKLTGLVSDLARAQADTAKSNVYGLVDRAKDKYNEHADVLTDKAADVSRRVKDAGGDLGEAVEHNPLTALSLAFLAGLVIGMMSRSR